MAHWLRWLSFLIFVLLVIGLLLIHSIGRP
jgi:hypothetical protein